MNGVMFTIATNNRCVFVRNTGCDRPVVGVRSARDDVLFMFPDAERQLPLPLRSGVLFAIAIILIVFFYA